MIYTMSYKILTIIGARPQFIKSTTVSLELRKHPEIEEIVLHTGQHFDKNMSDIFFEQLKIPKPEVELNLNGGSHGEMTGRMLIEIEKYILKLKPSRVLVYGDTNSTLAGALSAVKLGIPVAHVESGLRSYNMKMPEEINRIITDQISDVLFCPTKNAVQNLTNEGFNHPDKTILNVGDVMQDTAKYFSKLAFPPKFKTPNDFILATIHRAENTDDPNRLLEITSALNYIHNNVYDVIIPLHPRTKKKLQDFGLTLSTLIAEPVGYLEMLWLLSKCNLVLTDSGGIQKEAYFAGKYCITMRDETEWIELVEIGANSLAGANKKKIVQMTKKYTGNKVFADDRLFGGGLASVKIANTFNKEVRNAV